MNASAGLEILLGNSARDLWSTSLMRERGRFFRRAGALLDREALELLVDAILLGPPRPMYSKVLSEADFERLAEREIWRGLAKLRESGAELPRAATERLRSIEANNADLKLPADHHDEFASWLGQVESWDTESAESFAIFLRTSTPLEAAERLRKEQVNRIEMTDAWRALCEEKPPERALSILSVLTELSVQDGDSDSEIWRMAFSVFWSRLESDWSSELWEKLIGMVSSLPDSLVIEISNNLSGWVSSSAKTIAMEQEFRLWGIWDRLWNLCDGDVSTQTLTHQPLHAALNHSRGKITEALLFRLSARKTETSDQLPEDLRSRFDVVGTAPETSAVLARVILASRLNYLYLLDRTWTAKHLLTKLDWTSSEAFPLWSGYLWAPQASPDLIAAYKKSFLATVIRNSDFGEQKHNLLRLFAGACIYTEGILTSAEMNRVMHSLEPEGLVDVSGMLSDSLKSAGEKAETLWTDKIGPWLSRNWPVATDKQTARTSLAIARMIINAREALAQALKWALPFLRTTEHFEQIIWGAEETGAIQLNPVPFLLLLERVVPENIPSWTTQTLVEVLQKITHRSPDLAETKEFRTLTQIVERAR